MRTPPNALEVVKRIDSGFTSDGHDRVGEKRFSPPLPKRRFSATETPVREEEEPAAKRRRLSVPSELVHPVESVEEPGSLPTRQHADAPTCKCKRTASGDEVAGSEEPDAKRVKTSHSDGLVSEANYFPSTVSHIILPFADSEWAEHRIFAVPGFENETLWVCGRQIPTIGTIWPPEWPMGKVAREKKRQRAINEAYATHQLLCRRRKFVQSEAHQNTVHTEKIANDRRRQKLHRTLVAPMGQGRVGDATKIRQRLVPYKVGLGAIDKHERLRRDPAVFDKPWAPLDDVDKCAVAKWRGTAEGKKATVVKIKLQIGVNERPGRQRKWLGCHAVEISSIWATAEIVGSLLKSAHGLYRDWVLSKPKEVRAKIAKTKPARPYLLAALRGEEGIGNIESREEMEAFVGGLFGGKSKRGEIEQGQKDTGAAGGEALAWIGTDLYMMAGIVQIVIRPPWIS